MNYKKIKGSLSIVMKEFDHACRGQDDVKDHKHKNESIDVSKTGNNYELHDRNGKSAKEYFIEKVRYIEKVTKERTGKAIRKDAVKLCSWVVTVPDDLPKDKYKEFFQASYDWLCNRYKKENVITASVHLDETKPHMHFQFIPIVMDKKGGFEKLCAKNLETQGTLSQVHRDLKKYLDNRLGCEVNILTGTTGKNKKIEELKLEELRKECKKTEKVLNDLQVKVQKSKNQYIVQQESINNLIGNIPPLVLEELPPKPTSPQKPEWKSFYIDKKEEREDKKAWKNYDKEVQIYEKKIIPQWERDCDMINQRNEKKRDDYFNKYGNLENIKKMKVQVERTLYRVNQIEDKANRSYEKAEKERKAVEEERKQLEIQKQQQELNQQRIIQELVQKQVEEEIKEIKGKQERLESFCDMVEFNDGSTVLDRFLEQENKQKVEEIEEEKEEYLSPEDF